MNRHLSLVKNDELLVEKRVLPRFPFSYLTFKNSACTAEHEVKVFEVKEISTKGMQLSLKDGGHDYTQGQQVGGELRWKDSSFKLSAKVEWVKGERLGVSFSDESNLEGFLSIKNIIAAMRPLHGANFDMEIPGNLKYWVRSDGPVELFVWSHRDGEIATFQLILMDRFIEWEDGKGVRTGRVLTKRDLETPLITEDEFMFQMDYQLDEQSVAFGQRVVSAIPENYLSTDMKEFLIVKLC